MVRVHPGSKEREIETEIWRWEIGSRLRGLWIVGYESVEC